MPIHYYRTIKDFYHLVTTYVKPTTSESLSAKLGKGYFNDDTITLTYKTNEYAKPVSYNETNIRFISPSDFNAAPHFVNYDGILANLSAFKRETNKPNVEYGEPITLDHKVVVSDPCYTLDTWLANIVEITPGEYIPQMTLIDAGSWGTRVGKLEVWLKDITPDYTNIKETNFDVCVDSGTAGIYDYDYYAKHHPDDTLDDNWYDNLAPWKPTPIPLSKLQQKAAKKIKELEKHSDALIKEAFDTLDKTKYKQASNELTEISTLIKTYSLESHYGFTETHITCDKYTLLVSDQKGVTTSTAFGDGSYTCYLAYNSNYLKPVGIIIDYANTIKKENNK